MTATRPAWEVEGGEFRLTYVQRADDANLLYSLESCTNLVSNVWINFDYDVLGTNITGGEFNVVTSRIPVSAQQSFIRLNVLCDGSSDYAPGRIAVYINPKPLARWLRLQRDGNEVSF